MMMYVCMYVCMNGWMEGWMDGLDVYLLICIGETDTYDYFTLLYFTWSDLR